MTFAWAQPLGYLRTDQTALMPILDRAIDAIARGALAQDDPTLEKAIAAMLDWLSYGSAERRIALAFPRFGELQAVMVAEVVRRYQQAVTNDAILTQALKDGTATYRLIDDDVRGIAV
jgi:hypothetical protein